MINEFEIKILDENYKSKLLDYFLNLEKELKKEGIGEILFQIVYELINNAIKANLKRIFFLKKNYSFENPEEYQKGLYDFKKTYKTFFLNLENFNNQNNSEFQNEWIKALTDLGLIVRLIVDINQQRILIYIKNNTKMLPQEEKRLRESLAKAMKATNLVDFIIHYGQIEEEGEGLGLALVVFLIRDIGFSPEYFRVYKEENNTIARIEFPLSKDYIPIREKWKKNSN